MSLTLTPVELKEITGYSQAEKQRGMLDREGIPWRDMRGRTIVLREHVRAWMEGKPVRKSNEPRMDLVR